MTIWPLSYEPVFHLFVYIKKLIQRLQLCQRSRCKTDQCPAERRNVAQDANSSFGSGRYSSLLSTQRKRDDFCCPILREREEIRSHVCFLTLPDQIHHYAIFCIPAREEHTCPAICLKLITRIFPNNTILISSGKALVVTWTIRQWSPFMSHHIPI